MDVDKAIEAEYGKRATMFGKFVERFRMWANETASNVSVVESERAERGDVSLPWREATYSAYVRPIVRAAFHATRLFGPAEGRHSGSG